jgi:hypothetical protein
MAKKNQQEDTQQVKSNETGIPMASVAKRPRPASIFAGGKREKEETSHTRRATTQGKATQPSTPPADGGGCYYSLAVVFSSR